MNERITPIGPRPFSAVDRVERPRPPRREDDRPPQQRRKPQPPRPAAPAAPAVGEDGRPHVDAIA